MTTVEWEEVKRLAADFQKAQLSSTLQKLSERNCVEIVTKLVESKLLDIIFTNDGKEYVTPQHLGQEIKDELYIHGGRVSLVELARVLNVSLSQISKVASDIEKHSRGVKVILGQLLDRSYTTKIAEEINDKLTLQGSINVADLTLQYDLPAEFLQSLIEKELGKIVIAKQDSQDSKIFYTDNFLSRNKAKIRGALSAITKPTPLSAVLGQCSVPERIFFSILDSLQETKQIPGNITGKRGTNSLYVPTIYSRSQNEWVENFYKQNGYLEYDALQRLGISDPANFIKRHFPDENIVFLDSIAVGTAIMDQVEANMDEANASESFVDICPLLPSVFSDDDIQTLLKILEKKSPSNIHIFANTVIVSDAFLQALNKSLEPLAESKAKEAVNNGKWLQAIVDGRNKSKGSDTVIDNKLSKKDERRKKATSGKAGGGSQGRETKTKSTKKKYLQGKGREIDSDEEITKPASKKIELNLVSVDDIRNELEKDDSLTTVEGLSEELSLYVLPKLNKLALSVAEQLAQSNRSTNLSEIEERLNVSLTNIKIFDKGIKLLDKPDQPQLSKYLLKSLATDFVNELFKLAAQQSMLQIPENMTTESRQKLLLDFPSDIKEPLTEIHKAISGNSIEDFLNVTDPAMAACCLVLRKYDKKKEKTFILGHRQALIEELNASQDPALALHLITSILFIGVTQCALYLSGRHVATVLGFLKKFLQQETILTLSKYHDLVLQSLGASNNATKGNLNQDLEDGLREIKDIANDFKRHLKIDKIQE